jgi:hypothetical protein
MTDIRTIAQAYIDQGWSVVPLAPGEKRANDSWNKKTYAADKFKPNAGIAGKCGDPSGWRVDVDLDHPLAIEIAPLLLPRTASVHGRPGKPDSHYWYICENVKTRQFTDLPLPDGSKQMLVEIRSTGGYTALPPSVHPSGDLLAWASEGDALRLTPDELTAPVTHLAIATLMAIHWPGHGARHAMVGHLAAFLCQHGVNPVVVPRIIEAAACAARDADLQDRMNFARTTVQKYTADPDASLTGGPSLADAIGADVVSRLRQWLGAGDMDAVEEMNAKHFWVRMGKDDVIGREDDPDEIVFQRPHALYSEYADRQVQVGTNKKGEPQYKPLVQAWLASPLRRRYRKVVFAPPPMVADEQDYNLWRGYAVTPQSNVKVTPLLKHFREVICNDDPEHYEYLMKLLALKVQRPGERTGIAVVMRSLEGTGKNLFVDTIGALFHPHHYAMITKWSQVTGRFNSSLKGKLILFLNELGASTAAELGSLKSLITDERVNIEPKGVDATLVDNFAHVFFATNEDWAIPLGHEESRRYLCLRVSDRYAYGRCAAPERKAYFDRLFAARYDPEALGGLLYHLMQIDVSDFDRFDKPETNEDREQRLRSLQGPMQWLFDVLETGRFGLLGWPTEEVDLSRVYEVYELWARTLGQRPLDVVQWGRKVAKFIWVGGETRSTRIKNEPTRVGTLVTRDALQAALPPLATFKTEETTVIYVNRRGEATFETRRHPTGAATGATANRGDKLF